MAVLKWKRSTNVDRLYIEQGAQLSWKVEYKKNIFLARYSWKSSWLTPDGFIGNFNVLAKVNLDYVFNNKLSTSVFAFPILPCFRETKNKK